MSKRSRRHGKDIEYERGIIRELRKEIKNLKQRIKQLERMEYNYSQTENRSKGYVVYQEPKESKVVCPSCKEDYLESKLVVGRAFEACPSCKYRTPGRKVSNVE